MIGFKIIVTTEDFAQLFDCSLYIAKEHLRKIRMNLQKPARSRVTALEVAHYTHTSPNEIIKALNREFWKEEEWQEHRRPPRSTSGAQCQN